MDRVVSLGCVVCRNLGYGESPAEYHHIREGAGAGEKSGDFLGIPLCPMHHRSGGHGVAFHAGQRQFEAVYGSELDLLNQTIGELA
jgi:hypothetical protein